MWWLLSLSWTALFGTTLIVLLAYELCWIIYCRTFHPYAKFPGPFVASFSRLWLWKRVREGKLEQVETLLHQKHGRLVRIAPNELSCTDPGVVKELYRNRNPLEKTDFYLTWRNKDFGTKFPDNNFSVISEKEHSERRRIVNHVYSMSNVLQSEKYIDKCSGLFIQKLKEFADKSEVIDLGEWLQMYAFDVIGELYFGNMLGFLETSSDYQGLINSLDVLNPVMGQVAVSATYARPFVLISAIASSSVRAALKGLDHVTAKAKSCVGQRQEALKNSENSAAPRMDLLQQLFTIMEEKGKKVGFGIPEIQYEAWVALFAGSDTTAIAMRAILYYLVRNPTILGAVVKEIDEAFSHQSLDTSISYADAIKLPLLSATIKEGMRLHPSVGFTMPRISPAEGLQICGECIPPGLRIGINAHLLQRDKNVFGEDAEEFRPQRWLSQDPEKLKVMEQCMLVFGAGTRTCIGKNISLSEIHKLIPQILRNFELIPAGDANWKTENYWFNKQTGLHYRLKKRDIS